MFEILGDKAINDEAAEFNAGDEAVKPVTCENAENRL
jgi:hypothetical protein